MTANLKQSVPFFGVKNIEASVRFYVEGLGFVLSKTWKPNGKLQWCLLERDDVALMLQEFLPSHVPAEKVGVGISICIICKDAIALYHEYKGRNVDATRPFVGNGLWVTTIIDPDGYRLEFESLTDVPEDTVYSD
ncbi:MAG TPA: VOC family protein [Pyrinomonadaceae bacterium]|nr:VOC family protein [Pyrinomonadaceae bacterium]